MSRIWRQVDVNMRLICIDNPNQQAELCVAKTARSQTEIKKRKKKVNRSSTGRHPGNSAQNSNLRRRTTTKYPAINNTERVILIRRVNCM